MSRSLRFRITAWYVAFFSLLFVLFSFFLYGVLSKSLQSRVDQALLSEATTAASLFEDEMTEMQGDTAKSAAEVVAGMRLRDSVVSVWSASELLAGSAPVQRSEFEWIATRKDGALAATLQGRPARAAVHRVTSDGRQLTI